MKRKLRRIACHEIVLEDRSSLSLAVLEIQQGRILRYYPLTQELPFTEWVAGRIVLKRDEEGIMHAYYNNEMIN